MRSEPIYITYSKSQNAFHRERDLASMAMSNLRQLRNGGSPDWVVVAYAENEDEYRDVIESLNRILRPEQCADEILRRVDNAKARRSTLMPDEQSAINALFDAYQRLKEFGWREIAYCPKDGVEFDAIELGSTGIHSCVCQDGDFWIGSDRDTWPSNPVLYREPKSSENVA